MGFRWALTSIDLADGEFSNWATFCYFLSVKTMSDKIAVPDGGKEIISSLVVGGSRDCGFGEIDVRNGYQGKNTLL